MPDDLHRPAPADPPWMAGLRAARANLVPGFLVQLAMLSVLLAYYFYEPTRDWLDQLAQVKARWGYLYSAIAAMIAGAVIPEIIRVLVFHRGRVTRANLGNVFFAACFWGAMGMLVDFLYRCQAVWFGADATFPIVLKKVLVDQFLFSPFISAPITAWCYDWKNHGYRFARMGDALTATYFRHTVLPTVFAAWSVWIPIVAILYSLPSLLQIPLFTLALSLWVILYTWISEQRVAR